jgi:hypothetical protein
MAMNIRDRVRAWLGIDQIPSTEMLMALEKAEKTRHQALIEILLRIEKRMINEHIGTQPRTFDTAVLSWDMVEAMALRELEKHPE